MTDPADTKCQGNYHHGNLKQALVDAYICLLEDNAPETISLRKLASYVNVAPTAVYNHFADKDALTSAVRTRCLHHFGNYLESNYVEGATPEANLASLGKSYFEYSQEFAEYFKIIFQHTTKQEHVTEELLAAGMYAEERLRKTIIDLLAYHNIPITQYNEGLGAFACWAMAHGITTLAATHMNRAACVSERWPKEFMLNDANTINLAFEALNKVLIAGILQTARK